MAKKKKRKVNYSRVRGLAYLGVCLVFIGVFIFNYHSTVSMQDTKLKQTLAKKEELEKEKEELKQELELLSNPNYITRYAREKYVFTKEGETVIILPQASGNSEE